MSRKEEQVPKPEDWLRVQSHIRQLYVVDQRPLKEVSRLLAEQHGFHATQRMYKSRIQAWKFDKKFKETEWRQIIQIWKRRREEEGKESIFKIRGRTVTSAKIRKFLKRKKIDEAEFLATIEESDPLSDIVCWTPAGSPMPNLSRDSASAASNSDQETIPPTAEPRGEAMSWKHELEDDESNHASPAFVGRLGRRTPDPSSAASSSTYSERRPSALLTAPYYMPPSRDYSVMLRSGSDSDTSSPHLVYGIEGMALRSLTPDSVALDEFDDIVVGNLFRSDHPPSLIGESYNSEFPHTQDEVLSPMSAVPAKIIDSEVVLCRTSNTDLRPQRPFRINDDDTLASKWLSRLFQACIFHNQHRDDLVKVNARTAADVFQTMLQSQSKYLLPGLSVLAGILTAHNQWTLAADFLSDCCSMAASSMGPEHPFTIAFEHMRGVCLQQPNRITAEHLSRAIITFELAWAPDHPNTIVLKYYCAWDTLNQGDAERAADQFRIILPLAERVMGRSNYVTTAIMRSLSRAMHDLGRLSEAITIVSDALTRQRKSLGAFHPERLEGIRRLAAYHESSGDLAMAESHFEEALEGQIKMLGVNHSLTMGTLSQLSNAMKRRGRISEEAQLQTRIDALFEEDKRKHFQTPAEAF